MLTEILRSGSTLNKTSISNIFLARKVYYKPCVIHTAEELSALIGDMIVRDVDPSKISYCLVDSIEHLTDLSFKHMYYYATDKAIEVLYGSEEGAGRRRMSEVYALDRETGRIRGNTVNKIIMDDFL